MARLLRQLVLIMGIACAAIGVLHLATGVGSVPGEGSAGATVDNRERFYGAVFLGYGLAWIWASRQSPVPSAVVRFLAAVLLLGGVGRLVSLAVDGPPHWFQTVLMAIELALPPLYFRLAGADESAARERPGEREHPADRAPSPAPPPR